MQSVILVTGAGTGIGKLAAQSLAEAGHIVYASMRDIGGRNNGRAAELRALASAKGPALKPGQSVQEADPARREVVDRPDQLHFSFFETRLGFRGVQERPDRMAHVRLDRGVEQRVVRLGRIEMVEGRHDVLEQGLDPDALCDALKLRGDRGIHCPASLVAHDDEKRRVQVQARVLQRTHDRGPEHVASHANDEEFPERCVEHEFGRDAAVAASQQRRVGMLPFREVCEDFLLDGWEARKAIDETLVALFEALERLFRGERVWMTDCHDASLPKLLGMLRNDAAGAKKNPRRWNQRSLRQSACGIDNGVTSTCARPSSREMPISRAVAGERSTTRPFTYGPRSWMVITALRPVSRLVTLAVVPRGSVLLAALSSRGSMRVPSAIFRPVNLSA